MRAPDLDTAAPEGDHRVMDGQHSVIRGLALGLLALVAAAALTIPLTAAVVSAGLFG